MEIVQAPDAVLSQVAKTIEKIDKGVLDLIEEMKVTLVSQTDPEGIGLAAPQVGKSVQLFIVKPDDESPFDIYINPKIDLLPDRPTKRKKKEEAKTKLEGCLSLKIIWGTVKRARRVHAEWMDEKGEHHKATFAGFYATILQHEYDHLQGILFPRRVLEQNGQLYKSHKDKEGNDVFEPVEL